MSSSGDARMAEVAYKSWRCDACFATKRDDLIARVLAVAADAVWTRHVVDRGAWPSIYKAIKRANKLYIKIPVSSTELCVLSTQESLEAGVDVVAAITEALVSMVRGSFGNL